MQSYNSIPLHARTHWRRTKEVIADIAKYENINLSSYNMNTITCYTTCGDNFSGTSVTYVNDSKESPFVSDNIYDVYEVPSKTNANKYNFCGDFLFLAHNTSFDYWLFGTLTASINFAETKKTKILCETAKYCVYGQYTISPGNTPNSSIETKTVQGKNVTYGGYRYKQLHRPYDSFNDRKKAFCKKTDSQILSEILGNRNTITNIVDNSEVKKYNKNQKKRK